MGFAAIYAIVLHMSDTELGSRSDLEALQRSGRGKVITLLVLLAIAWVICDIPVLLDVILRFGRPVRLPVQRQGGPEHPAVCQVVPLRTHPVMGGCAAAGRCGPERIAPIMRAPYISTCDDDAVARGLLLAALLEW